MSIPRALKDNLLPSRDPCEVCYAHLIKGSQMSIRRYDESNIIPEHNHQWRSCSLVITGTLYLTIEGSEKIYRAGDWYEIAFEQFHTPRFEEYTEIIEFWFFD